MFKSGGGGRAVYWEKQGRDRMCGLHCLNSLLQGPYFSETDLSKVAVDLDGRERSLMAESGESSKDYKEFVAEGSHNISNDGFFSLSVIEECLGRVGVVCVPAHNPAVSGSLSDPTAEEAFLCNLADHWFAIRKVNDKWYNLDSLKPSPKVISDFYLSAFLRSFADQGYAIFVIRPVNLATGRRLDSTSESVAPQKVEIPPPGGFRHFMLPPPTDRLRNCQMLLSDADMTKMWAEHEEKEQKELLESKRLVEETEDGGSRGFIDRILVSRPSDRSGQQEKKEYTWPPQSGGRRLGDSEPAGESTASPSPQPGVSSGVPPEEMDDEVRQALVISTKLYLESLPRPPPEPPKGTEGSILLQVRFPDGSRHTRRFEESNAVRDIFMWLEAEATIDRETFSSRFDPPLAMREKYSLSSAIGGPRRKFFKVSAGCHEVSVDQEPTIANAGELTLGALALESQSTFNVQW